MTMAVTDGGIRVAVLATRVGQTFLEHGPPVAPFPSGASAIFVD